MSTPHGKPRLHPSATAECAINTDFVPADLDASRWEVVRPYFESLAARQVGTFEEYEKWLLDRSELEAACGESRADLYIRMTCQTDDPAIAGAWRRYIEETAPKLKPATFELDRRQTELAERFPTPDGRYDLMNRKTRVGVEIFREQNVELETEIDRLQQEHDQVAGAMTVQFDGKERTLPQMARYLEEHDRAAREASWRAVAGRRLQDRDRLDGIFDRLIGLRHNVALNAGFADYRAYTFKAKCRFDYGPEQCREFHDAVAQHVVPLVRRLDAKRAAALGVAELRPWDLAVDSRGRAPLRPFDNGDDLVLRTRRVFDAMDPELSVMFRSLGDNHAPASNGGPSASGSGGCLDLDSRKGKAPGGYQYMRDRTRRPFIFMNAAGLHRDVETMTHEAGHAFHSLLCKDEALLAHRDYPMEIAEVASMAMELLTMPHWGAYYPTDAERGRAVRTHLESSVCILPWIATIDAFQHWIYCNPGHTRQQRNQEWLRLDERFGRGVSWQGLGDERAWQWHRQKHLFDYPFYYIEYGIAQLGALGLWLQSVEKGPAHALASYKQALSLGGTRGLPELFAAAGLQFDFGPRTVERIVRAVEAELSRLPE